MTEQTTEIKEKVMLHIKEHGSHSLAYSALQEGTEFYLKDNLGFVAFTRQPPIPQEEKEETSIGLQFRKQLIGLVQSTGTNPGNLERRTTTHVLSNPVCIPGREEELIGSFLEEHPDACFWQTYQNFSEKLAKFGFKMNHFGFETILDLKTYNLSGNKKQNVRTANNRASREGLKLQEAKNGEIDWNEARRISNEWISSKIANRYELHFLARPLEYQHEQDVRIFSANKDGKMKGYVVFDPIYSKGRVTGYLADIYRLTDDSTPGLGDALVVEALKKFKSEGKEVLSLGLNPFYDVKDEGANFNPVTSAIFQGIFQSANALYGFQNLAFHKSRYDGKEEKVYFCSREPVPIDQTLDLFRICRVF